jgi:POT family proton-dependent oligopeptide transporter
MAAPERTPPQIGIVGEEGCERFSFHGVRSILVTYMVTALVYSQRDAKACFHAFLAAAYLGPIAGGWLAGRFLGRFRAIPWGSLAAVIGCGVLAAWDSRTGLFVGLSLVAVGACGIEPYGSALVADRFGASEQALMRRASGWLHWSIGLGSAAAYLLVPWLLRRAGPAAAFSVPGVAMAVALLVHWAGRNRRVTAPPSGPDPHGFLRVVGDAIRKLGTGKPGQHWLDVARESHPEDAVEGARAVLRLAGVFAAATVFWALFDQRASSWVLQGRQMDPRLPWGSLAPEQLQAANPLLLVVLVPLLARIVFPTLERRGDVRGALGKMTAGMFVTVLSFVAAAVIQVLLDRGRTPGVLWQLPQYVLMTIGEVLVSVTGLELATTQAPRSMRSTIASIWLLTACFGNLLTALVTKVVRLEGAACFWFFAAFALAAAIGFRFVARRYAAAPARTAAAE